MARRTDEKLDFKFNLKTYYNFIKGYKWLYLIAFVLVVIIESAKVAEKYLFKIITDNATGFTPGTFGAASLAELFVFVGIVYCCLVLIKIFVGWFQVFFVNRIDGHVIYDIKNKFFNHIAGLSHRFHSNSKTGSIISRFTRGSRAAERITDFMFFNFAPFVIQIVLVGATLIYLSWTSTIVVILTVVSFTIFGSLIIYFEQKADLKANNAHDRENANISDVFTNIDSIKYYGKEKVIREKYAGLSGETKTLFIKFWDYGNWFRAGQVLITGLGTFFIFYFPLISFLHGTVTIGTIAFIYTAYLGLMGPMYGFVHSLRNVTNAMADFQALFAYDKIKNDIEDKPDAKKAKVKSGKIEFEDVSFKYNVKKVIKDFNLKIKPGEKIALVGHSGSGKTTLIKLLYRFYDVNSGKIKIDGFDVKDVQQESLRGEMSIVPQEAILFDDTIYNNIKFSRPEASRKEIFDAMKFAQLDSFVSELPDKENTIVGERGIKLSGGEKQRVSIARAILANKKILVLDEATSALDSQTEHDIQKDLEKLMYGRTSLIIAHRLSTIMSADRIVVMNKGEIVQIGKHKDLIKKDGVYKRLWDLQKGGYI